MKTIRWIQNIAAVAAIVTVVSIADGVNMTIKDACVASVLVVTAMSMILGRALEEERRAK